MCHAQNAQVNLHWCNQLIPFVDSESPTEKFVIAVTCFSGRLQYHDIIKHLLVTCLDLLIPFSTFVVNFHIWSGYRSDNQTWFANYRSGTLIPYHPNRHPGRLDSGSEHPGSAPRPTIRVRVELDTSFMAYTWLHKAGLNHGPQKCKA